MDDSDTRSPPITAHRAKGLAKATRVATIRHRDHPALSRDIEGLLFRSVEIMTEGSVRERQGERSYFGSTMITCNLQPIMEAWRGPFDNLALTELHRAVEGSVRVKLRAMRIACSEMAHRVTERPLGTPTVETRVYVADGKLLLDVDLEVAIGVSSLQLQRE